MLKVIKEIIEANGQVVEAFVDDNLNVNKLCGKKVLHGETELSPMIVSIGVNCIRKKSSRKTTLQVRYCDTPHSCSFSISKDWGGDSCNGRSYNQC